MENTMKNLPVYKLRIKEDDKDKAEVEFVALVDDPAIQTLWMAFSKQKEFKFVANEERRIITGPFMIADMPIYRRDFDGTEYYVVFDKEEIFKIATKFFRKGYTSNFNLMHDSSQKVSGVYMFESMIVDSKRGVIAPQGFEGISEGSWLASVKVDNDEVWNKHVKAGKVKGFSVEGFFDYEYNREAVEKDLKELSDLVRGI